MPCKSWSLQAGETCPGSIDPATKKPVAVCAGCYAKDGFYNMPSVVKVRDENREDWKRDEWEDEMVALLDTERYFRWFDSGDCYHPLLAKKIYNVMKRTPWCNHWMPTKSYKIARIRIYLDMMKELPNASIRYSSDSINGEYTDEHGSTVIPYAEDNTTAKLCDAFTRGGKCGPCRACWNKDVAVIAYPAHGKRMMAKVKRMKQAA
jgi:hypothetical protein